MDWITGIQNAIDYIETHITEELDYEQIAKEWVMQADLCTDEDRPGFKAIWDEVKAEVLL